MKNLIIEMFLLKSTKRTHVYSEMEHDDIPNLSVPSFYIRKSALPEIPPKMIKIVISEID